MVKTNNEFDGNLNEYIGSVPMFIYNTKLAEKDKNKIVLAKYVDYYEGQFKKDIKDGYIDVSGLEDASLDEIFEDYSEEENEYFFRDLLDGINNLQEIVERKNGKKPYGYLLQASTFSGYGSICHNGQCGYRFVHNLSDMLFDDFNEMYLERRKNGYALHIVNTNHDATLDVTFKIINFDCEEDEETALTRLKVMNENGGYNNKKFLPTLITYKNIKKAF